MSTDLVNPIEGPAELSPEWYAGRKYRGPDQPFWIGASDAAAACNQSDYRTSLDLYLTARGEYERPVDPKAVTRMRRGHRLQSAIILEYCDEFGAEVVEPHRSYFHGLHRFMEASPDGIRLSNPRILVEAKSASPHMFSALAEGNKYGQEGTDAVPDDVLLQAQQQMAVMGLNECDVVVLFGVFVLKRYPILRHAGLIEAIVEAEQELVERIVNADPPEPEWSHPRTRELISELKGLAVNTSVTLSPVAVQHWLDYQRLGDAIKEMESERDAARNELLWAMDGAELGILPGGKAEVRRVVIKDDLWDEADVEIARSKIGQLKRKGHERLIQRKRKD